jgi:hypothetical protein
MAVALVSRRKKIQKVQTVLRALQVTTMMQSAAAERRKAEGAVGQRSSMAVEMATGLSAGPLDSDEEGGSEAAEVINPFSAADGSSHHHTMDGVPAARRPSVASIGRKGSNLKNAAFKVQVVARKRSFRIQQANQTPAAPIATRARPQTTLRLNPKVRRVKKSWLPSRKLQLQLQRPLVKTR